MFIESKRGYDRRDQQTASGRFVMLVQPEGWENRNEPFRAFVRHVRLSQCGHFMMGIARVFGESLSVSGGWGGDGLPMTVSRAIYDRATPVPAELISAWGKSTNHGPDRADVAIVEWARENLT